MSSEITQVQALQRYNDGSGSAIYAISGSNGLISQLGGSTSAMGLYKWDGAKWVALGDGLSFGGGICATTWTQNGVEQLVIGGSWLIEYANNAGILTWDGAQLAALPDPAATYPGVTAIATYQAPGDAQPRLYAAGDFGFPRGGLSVLAPGGGFWETVGPSPDYLVEPGSGVTSLLVFDDGSGPALYYAGLGTDIRPIEATTANIARWNGTAWSSVGGGLPEWVSALISFDDDGAGPNAPKLVAVQRTQVSMWNGAAWTHYPCNVGLGASDDYSNIGAAVYDNGSGPNLYIGQGLINAGETKVGLFRFNGTAFEPAAGVFPTFGLSNGLLAQENFGAGPQLLMSGWGTRPVVWDGTTWSEVGDATHSPYQRRAVPAIGMRAFDADGASGLAPKLYLGGQGQVQVWDGSTWQTQTDGIPPHTAADPTHVMNVEPFASGTHLFAAGVIGQQNPLGEFYLDYRVLRQDGAAWSTVGIDGAMVNNFDNRVYPVIGDFGAGEEVYAFGSFLNFNGSPLVGFARWNGSAWVSVGGGLNGAVTSAVFFNDGTGPAIYAYGSFTSAGGVAITGGVAKWNGTAWSNAGSGLSGVVRSGANSALYIANGQLLVITSCVGIPDCARFNRWNGASWTPDAQTWSLDPYRTFSGVADGGQGDRLYFSSEDALEPSLFHLSAINPQTRTWDSPDLNFSGTAQSGGVSNVVRFDVSGEVGLCYSGYIWGVDAYSSGYGSANGDLMVTNITGTASAGFARRFCPAPPCPADYNHSGQITVQDIFDFLAGYFGGSPAADINHSGQVTVQDIFDFLAAYFAGCP